MSCDVRSCEELSFVVPCNGMEYYEVKLPLFSKQLLCTTKYYSKTTLYFKVLLQYYSNTTPVLLCATKYYSSTTKYYSSTTTYYSVLQSTTTYYSVLQSTTPVLQRTTLYYKVRLLYYSSTTPYYKVLLQYYCVLQSTTPVLQRTTPVLLRTTKYYSSTTLYYKVLLQYYSVLQSTTSVLRRTTKYKLQYYCVLQSTTPVLLQYYSVPQSTTPVLVQYYSVLQSTTLYSSTTLYYKVLLRYYFERSFTMRGATGISLQPHQTLRLPRKRNVIIDPSLVWNVIYNAQSNRHHPATSPNTAPATQKEWQYCYETSFTMRGATGISLQPHQILRLPRQRNLMIDLHHIWNVIYNARSNRHQPPTSPNIAAVTQNCTPKS